MEVASSPASREHWLELASTRKQRRRCADDVEAIKRSCESGCGKKDLSECSECRDKAIDRLRARFCDSPDNEWFTPRKAFIQRLDGMFSDAKARRLSIKLIEESIESEKEAWYRWVLRKYPEFLATADRSIDLEDLKNMLNDPDRPLTELVAMMWGVLGGPADWPAIVDAFAEKSDAVESDTAALKQLYVNEFFCDNSTGELLENAQTYRDEYMRGDATALEGIINMLITDHQNDRRSQPQRQEFQGQIDALRRAKMAHEQKIKDKNNARNQASAVSEKLYDLPACHVCGSQVDTKDVFSCPICQAVVLLGGPGALTVFCSKCQHDGQMAHVEKSHDCEAGNECIQARDEDVTMTNDEGDKPAVCEECVQEKRITLYCSERCATENMTRHRQSAHGTQTPTEPKRLVKPLSEVIDSILKKGNPGLQFKIVYDS